MNKLLILISIFLCCAYIVCGEYLIGDVGSEAIIYNFDDAASAQPYDSSGNNNNGTWYCSGVNQYVTSGCAPITGSSGCVNFSLDSDSIIQFPVLNFLNASYDWSFSFWIYSRDCLEKYTLNPKAKFSMEFSCLATPSRYYLGGTGVNTVATTNLKEWDHIAITFDTETNNKSLYKNGNWSGGDTSASYTALATNNALGGKQTLLCAQSSFNGVMDDFVVFNKTLTRTEIQQIFADQHVTDVNAPLLTNPVCASCYLLNYSSDFTPTINVTCTDAGTCAVVRVSNDSTLSYTTMTTTRNCTAAGAVWSCTVPVSDQLPATGGTVYFTAIDALGNSHSTYNLSTYIYAPRYLKGNVTDSTNKLIINASIFIMANNSNVILYNATSDSNGKWNKTVLPGTYTVCGYAPYNQTLRGDCLPFIGVT